MNLDVKYNIEYPKDYTLEQREMVKKAIDESVKLGMYKTEDGQKSLEERFKDVKITVTEIEQKEKSGTIRTFRINSKDEVIEHKK